MLSQRLVSSLFSHFRRLSPFPFILLQWALRLQKLAGWSLYQCQLCILNSRHSIIQSNASFGYEIRRNCTRCRHCQNSRKSAQRTDQTCRPAPALLLHHLGGTFWDLNQQHPFLNLVSLGARRRPFARSGHVESPSSVYRSGKRRFEDPRSRGPLSIRAWTPRKGKRSTGASGLGWSRGIHCWAFDDNARTCSYTTKTTLVPRWRSNYRYPTHCSCSPSATSPKTTTGSGSRKSLFRASHSGLDGSRCDKRDRNQYSRRRQWQRGRCSLFVVLVLRPRTFCHAKIEQVADVKAVYILFKEYKGSGLQGSWVQQYTTIWKKIKIFKSS